MPAATLSQFHRLKNLGVFRDFTGSEACALRQWNLVYGFNASGKTTLSRVLASLGAGSLQRALPSDSFFEVLLSGGSRITSGSLAGNPLEGRLFVFNADFIEENLRWTEGVSAPIFYIGQAQAEAAAQLAQKENALRIITDARAAAEKVLDTERRALGALTRATARSIAEQLNLGRRYEAPNVVADYKSGNFDSAATLPDSELEMLRQVAALAEHPPKQPQAEGLADSLAAILEDAREVAARTVGDILLEDLRTHEEMLGWIKMGLDYHQAHELDTCLFCGGEFSSSRAKALAQAVDARFARLVADIARVKRRVEDAQRQVIVLREQMPIPENISADLRASYSHARTRYAEQLRIAERSLGEVLSVLNDKAGSPNSRMGERRFLDKAGAVAWDQQSASCRERLNNIIDGHNSNYDNFDLIQRQSKNNLKGHYLAADRVAFITQDRATSAAQTAFDDKEAARASLVSEVEALRRAVREHGPAADSINKMLKNYLGRGDIELSPTEGAFEIHRNGLPIAGPLSEGEKTALALCYFLTALGGDGRKIKDLIVAVDDPISSLDTRALHYAFNIIRRMLDGSGQLIILTHNLHFMSEVKKWLKSRARPLDKTKEPTASLLFVESVQEASGGRSSTLIQMPRYIRDYESEYHYLFSLLCRFSGEPAVREQYFYLMPNALRKVLEIFLAFHLPGPEGVADKLLQVTRKVSTLDAAQVAALDRFAQTESHSDNLDDLVSFSSMTLEETTRAVSSVFELMARIAPDHYARMKSVCA